VPALAALTLSTIVVAAQNVTAQPDAVAASPTAALAYLGTVSGGLNNTANGVAATIGGGFGNTASGYFATVGGGFGNIAAGTGSFVAGTNALNETPADIGVFLFADNSGYAFHSTAANEFAARATGGVRFVTAIDDAGNPTRTVSIDDSGNMSFGSQLRQMLNLWSTEYGIGVQANDTYFRTSSSGGFCWHRGGVHDGSYCNPGGGTLVMQLDHGGNLSTLGTVNGSSDRAGKSEFRPIDAKRVLARLTRLPLTTWRYNDDDASIRHLGPVAQDFRAAFGLGQDDRHIAMVDADGVAFAAIQGLHRLLRDRDREIASLKKDAAETKARLDAIEAKVGLR
jgi:hypothetical protein